MLSTLAALVILFVPNEARYQAALRPVNQSLFLSESCPAMWCAVLPFSSDNKKRLPVVTDKRFVIESSLSDALSSGQVCGRFQRRTDFILSTV